MTEALRTSALSKAYGRRLALRELDLVVERGVVFGYLGPNGAGKTTTIRLLTGLIRPSAGRAEVLGLDAHRDSRRIHASLGYLPGDFVAYRDRTAREYLRFLADLRGMADRSLIETLSERLGLALDQRIGTLSRGNRQKVGLVQAFMHQPAVLILDEPTSGLDPLVQREFHALVAEARALGQTVFLSSHVLSEVEAIADHVAILRAGALVVTRPMHELKNEAVRQIEMVFETTPPLEELRRVDGVRTLDVVGNSVHISLAGSTADLLRVAAPAGIQTIVTREADLEQIFLSYYAAKRST